MVFALALLLHPGRLLPIGHDFQSQSAPEEKQAEGIRDGHGAWQHRPRQPSCWNRVEGEHRQQTDADPCCLGEEGEGEFGDGVANRVEA